MAQHIHRPTPELAQLLLVAIAARHGNEARFTEAELDELAVKRGKLQLVEADDGTHDVLVRCIPFEVVAPSG